VVVVEEKELLEVDLKEGTDVSIAELWIDETVAWVQRPIPGYCELGLESTSETSFYLSDSSKEVKFCFSWIDPLFSDV